jgi:hypothetical protein
MPPDGNPPQVSWNNVTTVWQVLWNSVNGNPNVLVTRQTLQTAAGPVVPADTLLGCIRIFTDYSLIKCVNNGTVIPSPEKDSDFNQFRLTGKGNVIGSMVTRDNIK